MPAPDIPNVVNQLTLEDLQRTETWLSYASNQPYTSAEQFTSEVISPLKQWIKNSFSSIEYENILREVEKENLEIDRDLSALRRLHDEAINWLNAAWNQYHLDHQESTESPAETAGRLLKEYEDAQQVQEISKRQKPATRVVSSSRFIPPSPLPVAEVSSAITLDIKSASENLDKILANQTSLTKLERDAELHKFEEVAHKVIIEHRDITEAQAVLNEIESRVSSKAYRPGLNLSTRVFTSTVSAPAFTSSATESKASVSSHTAEQISEILQSNRSNKSDAIVSALAATGISVAQATQIAEKVVLQPYYPTVEEHAGMSKISFEKAQEISQHVTTHHPPVIELTQHLIQQYHIPPEAAQQFATEISQGTPVSQALHSLPVAPPTTIQPSLEQSQSLAKAVIASTSQEASQNVSQILRQEFFLDPQQAAVEAPHIVQTIQQAALEKKVTAVSQLPTLISHTSFSVLPPAAIASTLTKPLKISSDLATELADDIYSSPTQASAQAKITQKLKESYSLSNQDAEQAAVSLITQIKAVGTDQKISKASIASNLENITLPVATSIVSTPSLRNIVAPAAQEAAQQLNLNLSPASLAAATEILSKNLTTEETVKKLSEHIPDTQVDKFLTTTAKIIAIHSPATSPEISSVASTATISAVSDLLEKIDAPDAIQPIIAKISSLSPLQQTQYLSSSEFIKDVEDKSSLHFTSEQKEILSQLPSHVAIAVPAAAAISSLAISQGLKPELLDQFTSTLASRLAVNPQLSTDQINQVASQFNVQFDTPSLVAVTTSTIPINLPPAQASEITKIISHYRQPTEALPAVQNYLEKELALPHSYSLAYAGQFTSLAQKVTDAGNVLSPESLTHAFTSMPTAVQSSAAVMSVTTLLTDAGIDAKSAQPVLAKVAALSGDPLQLRNYLSTSLVADLPTSLTPNQQSILSHAATVIPVELPVIQQLTQTAISTGQLSSAQVPEFTGALASRFSLHQQLSVADVQSIASDFKINLPSAPIAEVLHPSLSSITLLPSSASEITKIISRYPQPTDALPSVQQYLETQLSLPSNQSFAYATQATQLAQHLTDSGVVLDPQSLARTFASLPTSIQSSTAVMSVTTLLTDAGIDAKSAQPVLAKVALLSGDSVQLQNYLSTGLIADLPSSITPTQQTVLSHAATTIPASLPVIQQLTHTALSSGQLSSTQIPQFAGALASRYSLHQQLSVTDVQSVASDFKITLPTAQITEVLHPSLSSITLLPSSASEITKIISRYPQPTDALPSVQQYLETKLAIPSNQAFAFADQATQLAQHITDSGIILSPQSLSQAYVSLPTTIQSSAAVMSVTTLLTDAGIDVKSAQPVLAKIALLSGDSVQLQNYLSTGLIADLPSHLSSTQQAILSHASTTIPASLPVIQQLTQVAVSTGQLTPAQIPQFTGALASRFSLHQQLSVADVQNIASDFKINIPPTRIASVITSASGLTPQTIIETSINRTATHLAFSQGLFLTDDQLHQINHIVSSPGKLPEIESQIAKIVGSPTTAHQFTSDIRSAFNLNTPAPVVTVSDQILQQINNTDYFRLARAVEAASIASGLRPDAVQIYQITDFIRAHPQPQNATTLANQLFTANPTLPRPAAINTAENIYTLTNIHLQLDKTLPAERYQQAIELLSQTPSFKNISTPQLLTALNTTSASEAVTRLEELGLSTHQIRQVMGTIQVSQAGDIFTAAASPTVDKTFGFTISKILSANNIPVENQAKIISQLSQLNPHLSTSELNLAVTQIVGPAPPEIINSLVSFTRLPPSSRQEVANFVKNISPNINSDLSHLSPEIRQKTLDAYQAVLGKFKVGSIEYNQLSSIAPFYPLLQSSPNALISGIHSLAITSGANITSSQLWQLSSNLTPLMPSLIESNPQIRNLYENVLTQLTQSTGIAPNLLQSHALQTTAYLLIHPETTPEELSGIYSKFLVPSLEATTKKPIPVNSQFKLNSLSTSTDINKFFNTLGVSPTISTKLAENVSIPFYLSGFGPKYAGQNISQIKAQQLVQFQKLLPEYLDHLKIDPQTAKLITAKSELLFEQLYSKYGAPQTIIATQINSQQAVGFMRRLYANPAFSNVTRELNKSQFWRHKLQIDQRIARGNQVISRMPAPFKKSLNNAAMRLGKTAAGKAAGKIATKLGIKAAFAAAGSAVPGIGNVVAYAIGFVAEKIMQAVSAIVTTIAAIVHDNVEPIAYATLNALAGLGLFQAPAGSGAFAQGFIGGLQAGLTKAGHTLAELLMVTLDTAFTSISIIIMSIPIVIALFMYIVNSGAYVVPPLPQSGGACGAIPSCWPTVGRISWPPGSIHGNGQLDAFDIAPTQPGTFGTPIYASHTGTVIFAGPDPNTGASYGNYVKILSSDGSFCTIYGHMMSVDVTVGQTIESCIQIGTMDSTGSVSPPGPGGSHLHYEYQSPCGTYLRGGTRIADHVPAGWAYPGGSTDYAGTCYSNEQTAPSIK